MLYISQTLAKEVFQAPLVVQGESPSSSEMNFLDINLTKDSILLLHAIHSPFYWRNWKKTILFSGCKNP